MKVVVEDEDLDRQLVDDRGGHLLHVHLEAAVARDAEHQLVAEGRLRPQRRRHSEAHRAQPAGGEPPVRLVEDEVLGCPHLMLAHVGRDDRVLVLRELVDPVDDILRLDQRVRRLHVGQRMLGLPFARWNGRSASP